MLSSAYAKLAGHQLVTCHCVSLVLHVLFPLYIYIYIYIITFLCDLFTKGLCWGSLYSNLLSLWWPLLLVVWFLPMYCSSTNFGKVFFIWALKLIMNFSGCHAGQLLPEARVCLWVGSAGTYNQDLLCHLGKEPGSCGYWGTSHSPGLRAPPWGQDKARKGLVSQ